MTNTSIEDADRFGDGVAQHITDAIENDIANSLYENWRDTNLDEGIAYAEWQFFSYADRNIKDKYNEFYGYGVTDEYCL